MCNEIRIFPMRKDEPRFYLDVQKFFLEGLEVVNDRVEKSKFLYYKNGIDISGDTLVLFKFDEKIIANAIVKERKKESVIMHGAEHKGVLYLDNSTIKVFNPISIDELLEKVLDINYSPMAKCKIKIEHLDIILQLINKNIDNKN